MTGDRTSADKFDELRRQAEKLLRDRPDAAPEQPTTALDLINELQIHQVELDIQNEELKQAQGELSALYLEYEALYEFAPCGYVTLNEEGIITRANLTAVRLLETERKRLMGDSFSRRISLERDYIFLDALNQAGLTGEKQTVELRLNREDAAAQWVRLDIEADRDETGWAKQWRIAMTDITERMQADEKLKRSEERYRRIVETAEEGIWLLDRKWETEFVNAQMAEMLGYPSDEMIGRHLLSFMDEQEQSRARELMARREQGVNEKHDFKFQRRDGADLWAIVSTNAIISDDGQFKHALAMVTDITERKRVEEELKASERKFRNIADNVPGLVLQYKLNPDGGDELLYISKGVEHLFEISQEAAIQNIGLLWNRIFKGDLDEYVASIKASSEALSFWEREFRIEMPDGGIKWVHACGVPAGQEDGSVVWDSLAIDITKQKESENALQKSLAFNKAIIDSSKDCIKTLDLCGNLLFMNKGGQRLLEIENIEPYLNQSWIAFWKGDDCLEIEKAVQSAKEGTIGAFEGYCPTAKGTPKWWDILISPIMDDKGVVHQLLSVSRDITKRKKTEQALKKSEEHLRLITDNLPALISHVDGDLNFLFANKAYMTYGGVHPGESIGKKISEILDEDAYNRAYPYVQKALKGEFVSFENHLSREDDHDLFFQVNYIPHFEANEVTGYFVLAWDVTERKRAEKALRESETRYRALFECAQDVILIADDEARYADANPAASLVLGYSHEELRKMSVWDIAPRSNREQVLQQWRKFIETGCQSGEYKAIRKDGTLLDLEYNAVANILPGRHLSLMRDITDRKRTEQALKDRERDYRLLAANLPEMDVYLFDLDLTFGIAEGSLMDRWGGSPDYFEGKKLEELLDQERRDFFIPTYQRALQGEHVKFDFSWQDCHFYHQVIPLRSENGEIKGGIALTQDITDRKRTQIALQKALEEKEVLLREIHHRVKNNMQAISSVLRMHARRVDNAQLTKIFNDCQNRIGAMSLIHEALYQSENLAKIDFQTYLKKLCRNLAQGHDAPRRRIDLTTSAADVSLNMDQGVAVGMIIAELISNAFKHAFPDDKGGAVSVHMDRPDGEAIRLVVSDTGKGLPPDFDIQNSSSLGMRLVSGAVTRELGGTIDVESDNGARFIIQFKQRPTRF